MASNFLRTQAHEVLTGLVDLLYPPGLRCLACGNDAELDEAGLCLACAENLNLLPAHIPCPRCGRPNGGRGCRACLSEPYVALDAVYGAYHHADTAQALVHALKYNCVRGAAVPLATGMAQVLREASQANQAWDVLTPIPLHPRRQRLRGFNQARLLAQGIAERSGLPVAELLARTRYTRAQATLAAEQRHHNLRGAFAPLADASGKRVLLIDDVCTTGATAEAAAVALRQAGASRVGLLCATLAGHDQA